jgi:P4 family phage/plasmid primase-like protien
MSYQAFMKGHKCNKKGEQFTHTSMSGGSYNIPFKELDTFFKLYYKHVIIENNDEFLTEKQYGKCMAIDMDMRYCIKINTRQHDNKFIEDIVLMYLEIIKEFVLIQPDVHFPVYVFEKPNVNQLPDGSLTKDGIHIIFGLQIDFKTQMEIRKEMIIKSKDLFENIPIINNLESVFDKGVSSGASNWTLIGSRKPNNEAYELVMKYDVCQDPYDKEFQTESIDITNYINENTIQELSVQCDKFPKFEIVKTNNIETNESHILNVNIFPENKFCELVKQFIDNDLLKNTCNVQPDWYFIGIQFKSLFGDDDSLFVEFTKKYGSDNKNRECEKWYHNYTIPRDNDQQKALNTIKKIAKETNIEKYNEIMKNYEKYENNMISKIIEQPTDNEIAKYFKTLYGDNHICISTKDKIWYYFNMNDNIWELDEGLKVRCKISNELCEIFENQFEIYNKKIKSLADDDKNKIVLKKQINKIQHVINMLKTSTDKNNIMRELQEELFDNKFLTNMNKEQFMLPIQNNKMINMDTLELTERTFKHKFDFVCNAKCIKLNEKQESEIRKYFMDLFVGNENVMNCVLNIIKSSLTGRLLRYIFFHTGDGSNGKSLFFNILRIIFSGIMDIVSKDVILEKKSNSHLNTEFEKLETCRLAYITELKEKDKLNTENIKKISGGDPIDVRSICKTNRTINPVSTLHVLTNELPKFDVAPSILKRIVMIPYKANFIINKSFESDMLNKKDEIFTFIMKHGKIMDNFEDDNIPEEMNVMKKQYADDNKFDYLQDFINDKFDFVENGKIQRDDFRLMYNGWCGKYGYPIDKSTNTKFTRLLKEQYKIQSKESNGKSNYIGIKIKQECQLDSEDP